MFEKKVVSLHPNSLCNSVLFGLVSDRYLQIMNLGNLFCYRKLKKGIGASFLNITIQKNILNRTGQILHWLNYAETPHKPEEAKLVMLMVDRLARSINNDFLRPRPF